MYTINSNKMNTWLSNQKTNRMKFLVERWKRVSAQKLNQKIDENPDSSFIIICDPSLNSEDNIAEIKVVNRTFTENFEKALMLNRQDVWNQYYLLTKEDLIDITNL